VAAWRLSAMKGLSWHAGHRALFEREQKRPVRPATATFRLMPISSMSCASSPVWSSRPSPRRRVAAASAPRWGSGLVDVFSV